MQFTLRQIQLFVAVCDSGSVTQSANDLHVAQSAVSTAIKTLERALNIKLLIRNHAVGVTPTPEGREFLLRARVLLQSAQELELLAGALTDVVAGPIQVGFLVTIAPIVMPRIVREFGDLHRAAQLVVSEGHQDELFARLRSGAISVAITYNLGLENSISFLPLLDTPPHALLSVDHPLADRSELALGDLAAVPLILLDLPISSDYFLGLFRQAGVAPLIGQRSRQMDVVRSMVGQNLGYSLINLQPPSDRTMDGRQLVSIPIAITDPSLQLGVASVTDPSRTATTRALVSYLREWAHRAIAAPQ